MAHDSNVLLPESEIEASVLVEHNMTQYAEATIESKLPDVRTGLKRVQTRSLFVASKNNKLVKLNTLVGAVMAIHPHGDNSIGDAITHMSQPWNNCVPLIVSDGSIGTYSGDQAAAGRYIEVGVSDFCRDVFFNRTSPSALYMVPSETNEGLEPDALSPCIPYSLLTNTMGLAIGYSMRAAPCNLIELCDAVEIWVRMYIEGASRSRIQAALAPYLVPDFPVENLLRNREELVKEYAAGNFIPKPDRKVVSAVVDGTLELEPDLVRIHTLPYGIDAKGIYNKLGRALVSQEGTIHEFVREVRDLSSKAMNHCKIVLYLRRGVDVFEVLPKLKEFISFTQEWSPMHNYVGRSGKRVTADPIDRLGIWYAERTQSIRADLRDQNNRLIEDYRRLEAISLVVEHARELFEIFHAAATQEEAIEKVANRFKLTGFQAKYLAGLTYGAVTRRGKDSILQEMTTINEKIRNLQLKFGRIHEIVLEDVRFIKKKYGPMAARRTCPPNFIGAVVVRERGVIQVRNVDEIAKLVNRFGDDEVNVLIYPQHQQFVRSYCYGGSMHVDAQEALHLPKEFPAQSFSVLPLTSGSSPHGVMRNTVVVNRKEQQVMAMHGTHICTDNPAVACYHIGDSCTTISRTGTVETRVPFSSFALRKSLDRQGIKSDVVYASPTTADEVIVVHANDREVNVIRVDLVGNGKRISAPMSGKMIILGVFCRSDSVSLAFPKEVLNRVSLRNFYCDRAERLLGGSNSARLQLSTKTSTFGKRLVPWQKESYVWTLEN